MPKELTSGRWFDVTDATQHKNLLQYGNPAATTGFVTRVQIGKWAGPGRYLLLQYLVRCPRNCCDDGVNEVLTAAAVADKAREAMRALAELLREAKKACVVQGAPE